MSTQPEWLEQLESRIQQAAERMRELGEENATLREKVGALEKELAETQEGAASAWDAERDDIRTRVEALAGKLEALLTD